MIYIYDINGMYVYIYICSPVVARILALTQERCLVRDKKAGQKPLGCGGVREGFARPSTLKPMAPKPHRGLCDHVRSCSS